MIRYLHERFKIWMKTIVSSSNEPQRKEQKDARTLTNVGAARTYLQPTPMPWA